MGLINAVSRLRNSTARSKIIIALTDGVNNAGAVDPLTAAKVAATYNIKIYTIGVGTDGIVQMPVQHPIFGTLYQNVKVELDERTLQAIAETTNGRYYRATNPDKLRQIYREIDKLEKSNFEQNITNYMEEFFTLVFVALLLLFAELILRNTLFLEIY
jgi:Ca-activated chloride channel family protein